MQHILFMVFWVSIYTAYSALPLVIGIPGQTAGFRDHRHEDYIVRCGADCYLNEEP